jgi:arylsulfatase A-like enzyme
MFIRLLRKHGYKLATFSSFADRHDAFWYSAGWNEVHSHSLKKGNENADEVMVNVLPWVRRHGAEDNYFLHIQLWDPHRNYTMPQSYSELFANDPPPAWPDETAIASHQDNYAPFSARILFPYWGVSRFPTMPDRIENREHFKQFVDSYDGAVRFMDEQLGQLFDTLEELGVLHDTAVIISSDHGEAMGEHGVYGDHVCADEAVHHIPMIVKWPGIRNKNTAVDHFVYNVDLFATIVELLNIPVPDRWDGRSFAPLLQGGSYTPRDYLVWDHALYSVSRSVRTKEWLMMRTYHPGLVPLEPYELYNMVEDPFMTTNLAAERPDVLERLNGLLEEWHQEQTGAPDAGSDPLPLIVDTGPYRYIKKDFYAKRLLAEGREDLHAQFMERVGGLA